MVLGANTLYQHKVLERLHRLVFPNIEPYGLHQSAPNPIPTHLRSGVHLMDVGGGSAQGDRPHQIDRFRIIRPDDAEMKKVESNGDKLAFFAVYDGHGTDHVSEHAAQNLHKQFLTSPHLRAGRYEEAIREAIKREDKALLKELQEGIGNEEYAASGSTVSICVINLTRGVLVIGNLGDSPILLAECKPGSRRVRKTKHVSESHKPSRDDEKHRIEKAGGRVNHRTATARIGTLNVSRALGDLDYKTPLNQSNPGPLDTANLPVSVAPPDQRGDFVSAEPYLKRILLSSESSYFLAMVTDGVTESMNDEDVTWWMSKMLGHGVNAESVAGTLTGRCASYVGSDNATCVAIVLDGDRCV